jgi:DNA-binding GntR family transcriptional regulator
VAGVLEPIAKRSAEAQALDQLRRAVIGGSLAPGARLTEVALAEQLETSRATIRTALHHLVAEGLAVQVPYTGWMVTSLSAQDAWELVTLRASLEALGASLSAERATPDARDALRLAFNHLVDAAASRHVAKSTKADVAFHQAVIAAAGHDRLVEHYRRVLQQISVLIATSNTLLSDPMLLVTQHQPIYTAICERDTIRAAATARAHVEDEGAALVSYLKQREAEIPQPRSVPKRPK